jgi:hypothetical protein
MNVRAMVNSCSGYTLQVRHRTNAQKLHRALRFYPASNNEFINI